MPRMAVVLSDEISEALKEIADERGATISNLIRMSIVEFLERNGKVIKKKRIAWGGDRRSKQHPEK